MSEQSPVPGFATAAAEAKTLNRREAQVVRMIARVPYLNSVPFFQGWPLGGRYELTDCVPRELGARAAAGEIVAGPLPLMDFFRLEATFERLGHAGIAVRGRAHSALLFSRKPIRQLEGATIAITDETSTTVMLLRLVLEKRYGVIPASYERRRRAEQRAKSEPASPERRQEPEADALLLIGDEALRFKHVNMQYPFEIDIAFEWWLWQHLPFVFAVWAIRKDAAAQEKKQIEAALMRTLAVNLGQLESIAQGYSAPLGIPTKDLQTYLSNFVYRMGSAEESAIKTFRELVNAHHLL